MAAVVRLRNDAGEEVTPAQYKREFLRAMEQVADVLIAEAEAENADEVKAERARGLLLELKRTSSGPSEAAVMRLMAATQGGKTAHMMSLLSATGPRELALLLVRNLPAVPEQNEMAELIGPCYVTSGVMELLGRSRGKPVSRQAVDARRRAHSLLAMKTSDDQWMYPVWQFNAQGDVRADVGRVMAQFGDSPAWSVATWFMSPDEFELGGMTPLGWLDQGKPVEVVERLAAQTARRWAA